MLDAEEIQKKIITFMEKNNVSKKDQYFLIRGLEIEILEDIMNDTEEETDDFGDFEEDEPEDPVDSFIAEQEKTKKPGLIKRNKLKVKE